MLVDGHILLMSFVLFVMTMQSFRFGHFLSYAVDVFSTYIYSFEDEVCYNYCASNVFLHSGLGHGHFNKVRLEVKAMTSLLLYGYFES